MSNYLWLLDAGHGGMTKDGTYTTAPGKMHIFSDGLVFYEGVNNRAIVRRLVLLLREAKIRFMKMHDEELDLSLRQRVMAANMVHQFQPCIYLSIHSDAMPEGAHGKGSGFAIYTSPGQTASDRIANIFSSCYEAGLKEFKSRKDLSDGDADKEEAFYVLKNTTCPAILVETLFFDNRKEAEFLLSAEGQQRIAQALFNAILETETADCAENAKTI